jgi:hypothetical protein
MWHPIQTVGLAEYLAAEGGPNWYQQLAKSKLGTPDIEFNRINKYVSFENQNFLLNNSI